MLTEENKPKQTEEAKRYRLVVRSAEEAVRMIRENLEIMQKLSRSAKLEEMDLSDLFLPLN